MATTTPNFGWPVPTSTDLVKDGATAIEALGDGIDTSMVDLKGGTTGQILAKATNTDMDFAWITNDVGDITGVTAGTGISGGGTSGTVTVSIDTAVTADLTTAQTLTNKTLTSPALTTPTISTLTTNGDLLYGTGSGALARKGIGTTGQVLTVVAGLPSWSTPSASASGLTFITGASFSAVASVSLPNSTFTSTYTNYKLVFNITSAAGAAAETRFRMRASGTDDTAANYYMGGTAVTYTGVNSALNTNGGTYIPYGSIAAGSGGISSQSTQFEMTLFSPQTSSATVFTTMGGRGSWTYTAQTGVNNSSTAFDALTYYVDAGTITGNYRVYGIANS